MSLGKIRIRDFEPKTAKSQEEVRRKKELRDKIIESTPNLEQIKKNCRSKKFSLDICFYLYEGNPQDTTRYTKDLDNLVKIILDVLPNYMDSAKQNEGLGLMSDDRDDLIYEIRTEKKLVQLEEEEGIDIEIFDWKQGFQNLLRKSLFTNTGNCTLSFQDGTESNGQFEIKILSTGTTEIECKIEYDGNLALATSKFTNVELRGETTHRDKIIAKNCFIFRSQTNDDKITLRLSPGSVTLDEQVLNDSVDGEILIKAYLMNVHSTFRVFVDTSIGELHLRHFGGINELQDVIRAHNISLVTSIAEIRPEGIDGLKISEIRDKAKSIINDFLKITSLAQTVWHSMVSFEIYQKKKDEDEFKRLFLEVLSPKTKSPRMIGLTNQAYSSIFIKTTWKGYTQELENKYGFGLALEWYLDSWSSSVLESKYLSATTCLELLMDKFHLAQNTAILLSDDDFNQFQPFVKSKAREKLHEMNIASEIRSGIYDKLGNGLNYRSFANKAKRLLDYWKIKYSDLNVTINEIVKIRNDITHRGHHVGGGEEETIFRVYLGLITILSRIFLAMLNYKGEYYDFATQKLLKFEDMLDSDEIQA